ncbi:MAG TPA: hypothetical protein EYN16_05060 [Flavobacteriaceae bacterium]|nr:hypothetical protein [Flavobacteriaceae bacterium]
MKHTTVNQLNSDDYKILKSLYYELRAFSLADKHSISHIITISKQAQKIILGLPENQKSLTLLQKVYEIEERFLNSPSSNSQLNLNSHFNIQRYAMDAIYEMM